MKTTANRNAIATAMPMVCTSVHTNTLCQDTNTTKLPSRTMTVAAIMWAPTMKAEAKRKARTGLMAGEYSRRACG